MALRGAVEVKPFAELVFHVLAHVESDAPASAFDPAYVAWSEARIGPSRGRHLGEDARALAALLAQHDELVRAQLLAWLFHDRDRARRGFERPLAELGERDVDDPRALAAVRSRRVGEAAELLWCAVALEDEAHRALPSPSTDGVAGAIGALEDVAPLDGYAIGVVRALRVRGRVRDREIWIGCAEDSSLERVAWQAAHEATVASIDAPFAEQERRAIELLRERAARAGLEESHARWLSTLRLTARS